MGYATRVGLVLCLAVAAAPGDKADRTKADGAASRNSVNLTATGLSHDFPINPEDPNVHVLGTRVKWKAQLGSRSYGNPTIAGGKIFVGTNNGNPRNNRDRDKPSNDNPEGDGLDKSVLMCFDEKTGAFLWQMVHDKLDSGQVHDYPSVGLCPTPVVNGDRVYYTSNRCEVVCLDVNGFANGNQGFQDEKYKDKMDGDVIWTYDMMKELKVFPHNQTVCSPLIVGDLLFVVTGNGVDENHVHIPFPEAPSFICLNKNTGKLVWQSNLPGKNIMHGSWSHAAYGVFKGKAQVIFPGGDGWVYSFHPPTGKLIWKFDANPKDSVYELGGKGTRSDFIGMPVVYKDRIFIGTGQDPEHFDGTGHMWCIDPTREGDISPELVTDATVTPPKTKPNPNSGAVWHFGGEDNRPFAKRDILFGRTMSTACIVDDVIYITDIAGYLHCLDANTGRKFWQWDTKSAIWGSPYYVDGKVLVANEDGDLFFFKHEKKPETIDEIAAGSNAGLSAERLTIATGLDKVAARKAGVETRDVAIGAARERIKSRYLLQVVEVGENTRSTPIVANGMLYIKSEKSLFAVSLR